MWTKLELFGFTSSFAERMHGLRLGEKGQPRYAFDVELGFEDSKLTQKAIKHGTTSGFNTPITYEHFHDTPGWTLPPQENLHNESDLKAIEPMLIALSTPITETEEVHGCARRFRPSSLATSKARRRRGLRGLRRRAFHLLSSACKFGFSHAVESFLALAAAKRSNATEVIDARGAHVRLHTLMLSVLYNQHKVLALLLKGGDARRRAQLGKTALHLALSLGRAEAAEALSPTTAPRSWRCPWTRSEGVLPSR